MLHALGSLLALKLPLIAAVVVTSSIGAAVLTSTNVIPSTAAGESTTPISGYAISEISYKLNVTDPSNVDAVTFTATANNGSTVTALSTIIARFDASAGFYRCVRVGGDAPAHLISCNTRATVQLTVIDADAATVVIAE